jgi:peptidoglycan/xylan/chitin deacetylase (PgdA/CDA1 family)
VPASTGRVSCTWTTIGALSAPSRASLSRHSDRKQQEICTFLFYSPPDAAGQSGVGIRVALTFDAEHPSRRHCPPGVQEALLDVLDRRNIRATFFIQGRWAKAYPGTARTIAAAGHLVGNHSHYHARMPLLSDAGLRADVLAAQTAIDEITGIDPRPWFRCPFGDGSDDPRVLATLHELGYRDVNWDADAADWDAERSTLRVARDAVDGVRAHGDGAIALFHTWPATTLEVLPSVLEDLDRTGAEYVGLDQLDRFAPI